MSSPTMANDPSDPLLLPLFIPSSVSSTSIGSLNAPSSVSYQAEATATRDQSVASSRGAELDGGAPVTSSSASISGAVSSISAPRGKRNPPAVVKLAAGGAIGSGAAQGGKGGSFKNSVPMGAGGRAVVCCHWKNKGWCRYQDQCKFAHPEHKRGAGMIANSPGGSVLRKSGGSAAKVPMRQQAGQSMPLGSSHAVSCVAFMPPGMQPIMAHVGCIYPFLPHGSSA